MNKELKQPFNGVYNSLNVSHRPKNYKIFEQPSMTVPDQSLSIKQIIDRHTKGLALGGSKTPIYDEDGESMGINPKTLDLTELHDMATENKEHIAKLNATIEKNAIAEQQAIKDAELEAEIEKRLTEHVKPKTNTP